MNWPILLITLLGFGLRALRLPFQPLWWDEGYSVWFATHPVAKMAALTAQDIHPPFYYALLHGWTQVMGTGPVALRLLSVVVGTLAIPGIYLAGCRLLSRRTALLAASLLAISPLHIFYSQEVRMYGLVALLSIGVLAAAWRVLGFSQTTAAGLSPRASSGSGGKRWYAYAPYVAFLILALYTQYYAVFLPVGLTVYALWRWRRHPRALLGWLAAQVLAFGLFLPWVLYAAPKLIPYVSQKVVADADRPLGLPAYLGRHLAAFLVGHLEGVLRPFWPLALLLLVPLSFGWWLLWRRWLEIGNRDQAAGPEGQVTPDNGQGSNSRSNHLALIMLAVLLLTALVLGFGIGLTYPFFPERGERLLLLALPPFLLLVAASLDALWARARGACLAVVGLMCAFSAASLVTFYLVPRYADDDYRPLIARVVEQGLPGDTFFCVYPWQVGYWRSYGDPAGPEPALTPDASWSPAVAGALDALLARGRVWFPAHLALGGILETQIETYLGHHALAFANAWYGPGTRLSAWARSGDMQPIAVPAIRFPLPNGKDLTLTDAGSTQDPIPAANSVAPLWLGWQADAAPPVLRVSVRLVDDLNQIWAQHDYEPLGGLTPGTTSDPETPASPWRGQDRLGLLIPAGTPPGRYEVEIAVQTKGALRPLEAMGSDGTALGTTISLFEMVVTPADRLLGPERLPVARRMSVDLGDGLRFLGYTVAETVFTPGELRKISLFWEAIGAPRADYRAFLQLLDHDRHMVAGWESPPGAGHPTSRWRPGTLIRTQAQLRPPAALPDGRYALIAGLFDPASGRRLLTAEGAEYISLGTLTVRGRPHQMNPPRPSVAMDASFGDLARLIGYDLGSPATSGPGDVLPITLYWQARATPDRAYTVFIHLLDKSGGIHGYGDGEPGGGRFPTTGWLPGEYLPDPHEVVIAADAPAGDYRLAVGLYDPASGERLTTPTGADAVILDAVVIVR